MKKQILAASLLAASSTAFAGSHGSNCGTVTIAEMNWATASLFAYIDKFVLENAFGCEVEVVPGDTVPTSTSMIEKQQPDIAPELWTNSFQAQLDKAVGENKLAVAGEVFIGEEGLWIPKYMLENNPELSSIDGIKANSALFPHPEDDSVGAYWGCPAGWGCQMVNQNLFKAYEMEDSGFELVDPGTAAGLDASLSRAYNMEKPWFGYYWAPTAFLGQFDMVKVDLKSDIDADYWKSCIVKSDCTDPKPSNFPESPVYTYTTQEFADRAPEAFAYLDRFFDNPTVNKMAAWMNEEQANGEIAAEKFFQDYPELWKSWLTPEQIKKVEKAVAEL
ncbi:glycine betaine transporter periplasmic subunit [Marinobacterium sp. xm-d-420]|jgi:glycine betaine/proline transport system substrate-binding protein|uniref:glycine betaine ABC transporter substrate-binding protein n=1 Tax=unclassified Marinobacterium TaxID=2644139 RepID=UPI001569949A|nr:MULTISPECIES: glycine betaine ABC transporter substrate-binding protein [unclassified Marinobacterium]NRP09126.1 glycine betaine transporter periplasmic subunit [Marinobacterium sp. xm-g-48]NRP26440.1 glycine betaine transporter periplasmic subunit [Marinobacterium sp. xm-d-420]NRP82343.1 glycine betaine transporter periplasmic subunit [Marinobacterium sp. xm-d-509]